MAAGTGKSMEVGVHIQYEATGNHHYNDQLHLGPKVIKIFMLNSAEHGILNANEYKNIKKFSYFQAQISLERYFSSS